MMMQHGDGDANCFLDGRKRAVSKERSSNRIRERYQLVPATVSTKENSHCCWLSIPKKTRSTLSPTLMLAKTTFRHDFNSEAKKMAKRHHYNIFTSKPIGPAVHLWLLLATSGTKFVTSAFHCASLARRRCWQVDGTKTAITIDDKTAAPRKNSFNFIRDAFEDEGNKLVTAKLSKVDMASEAKISRDRSNFPVDLFVDHDWIKEALVLAAINQRIGGILIYGGHGTGKSVIARTVEHLFPTHIDRIKDDPFNSDPSDTVSICELNGISANNSKEEVESIPTPVVTVPLNVMEDALIGSVDIEKSLSMGRPIFSPGLLAKAHRGILYADDINLLEDDASSIIMNAVSEGFVKVEREGLSLQYPCRPLLLGTYNPEEGDLREHLLDRVGISLPAHSNNMTIAERVKVVENVENFVDKTITEEKLADMRRNGDAMRDKVAKARNLLPKVEIESEQLLYLCEEATRAGCEGQRAEIFATEIAKASAAFEGRVKVNADDLKKGVLMAILPRGRFVQTIVEVDQDNREEQQSEEENKESENKESENSPNDSVETSEPAQEEEELIVPQEFMFGVDAVPLDPKLLMFQQWARKGKGGKHSKIFNLRRGRFVKAIFPKGHNNGRIAVGATLRAAAPYQLVRRQRSVGTRKEGKLVHIRNDDFRIQRLARKAGSLVIFVVDASGSMALNRMGAAKGAAIALLQEAYKSRDKICLIAFHDDRADVVVPPTRSIVLTKDRLEAMPCGGGSPLAHGLTTAVRTGMNALKVKQDVAQVLIVLLTDGRANVPLYVSMGDQTPPEAALDPAKGTFSRKFLKDEVLEIAKKLGSLSNFNFLCVDTEDKFVGTGVAKELARVALGRYHHLAPAETQLVAEIAKNALRSSQID